MPFKLSHFQKEKALTLTFLLINVSLGSAKKLKTSVDYVHSLMCQSRFHVAVSVYFETLWSLETENYSSSVHSLHPPWSPTREHLYGVDILNSKC